MKDIQQKIDELKPWYQTIQLEDDLMIKGHGGCGDPAWPFIKRYLEPIEGKRILDLGSNAGIHAIRAAQAGALEVVCLEAQDQYYEQAAFIYRYFCEKVRNWYPIVPIRGFAENLASFGLGRFDTVLAISILYHVGKLTVPGRNKQMIMDAVLKTVEAIASLTDHVIVRVRKEHDEVAFREMFKEHDFENTRTDRDSRIFMEFKR